jgi:polar amino acid transport system substrate-binding protein
MKRCRRLLALSGLAWGMLAGAGSGAAELLVVGTEFSKVYEQAPNGDWQGLGVEIVRTLAQRAGDTVQFQIYPWPRAQAMVQQGRADILVGPYKTPERRTQFAFFDQPFYRDRMVFYARRGLPSVWSGDYSALKGVRLAAVRGWNYGTAFEQIRPSLDIDDVAQLASGAQMLALGRVALLAANERNAKPILESLHLNAALTEVDPPIAMQDGYLAFSNRPQLEAAWLQYNQLFNQMVGSGELARLAAKYGVTVPPAPRQ